MNRESKRFLWAALAVALVIAFVVCAAVWARYAWSSGIFSAEIVGCSVKAVERAMGRVVAILSVEVLLDGVQQGDSSAGLHAVVRMEDVSVVCGAVFDGAATGRGTCVVEVLIAKSTDAAEMVVGAMDMRSVLMAGGRLDMDVRFSSVVHIMKRSGWMPMRGIGRQLIECLDAL